MRPLAMLLGIVMGSAVSIAMGLVMTLVVFLFLPEYSERIDGEYVPLLRTLAVTVVLAAAAIASFYSELRNLPWRGVAHALLTLLLVSIALVAIPRD